MVKKNSTGGKPGKLNYRLPRTVIPSRYEITLTPDLKTFRFSGHETIHVDMLEPVSEVVLNAKNLKIKKAWISNDSGTALTGAVTLLRETEMARIAFNGTLGKGNWKLHITFKGVHNDKLRGF